MNTTSISLLEQLRQPSVPKAWERFVQLYTPLLWHWARGLGLQIADASDLVQDVLVVLVRKMPEFEYQAGRTFRGWMRTVLLNKWRDRQRSAAPAQLDAAFDPPARNENDGVEEQEYRLYVAGRALQLISTQFEPATWKAYWETVVCDRQAAEVAAELGLSLNALYVAKSRVLAQLRRELGRLLD